MKLSDLNESGNESEYLNEGFMDMMKSFGRGLMNLGRIGKEIAMVLLDIGIDRKSINKYGKSFNVDKEEVENPKDRQNLENKKAKAEKDYAEIVEKYDLPDELMKTVESLIKMKHFGEEVERYKAIKALKKIISGIKNEKAEERAKAKEAEEAEKAERAKERARRAAINKAKREAQSRQARSKAEKREAAKAAKAAKAAETARRKEEKARKEEEANEILRSLVD